MASSKIGKNNPPRYNVVIKNLVIGISNRTLLNRYESLEMTHVDRFT
jgi:hypothetical protein